MPFKDRKGRVFISWTGLPWSPAVLTTPTRSLARINPKVHMAPPLYIPIHDPFAILGICLLFLLIICATILLIFTARKSAQEARRAIRAQNRYQRLFQLNQRGERAAERRRTIASLQADWASGPQITIMAPSASSSLRSTVGKTSHTSRNEQTSAIKTGHHDEMTSGAKWPTDDSSPSSSLLSVPEGPSPTEQYEMRPLPRPLRVGRHSWRFGDGRRYQRLGEASDSEEDISGREGRWWKV